VNYLDVNSFNAARSLVKHCEKIDLIGIPDESTIGVCLDKLEVVGSYCKARLLAAGKVEGDLPDIIGGPGMDEGKPIDLLAKDIVTAMSRDKLLDVVKYTACLVARLTAYYRHRNDFECMRKVPVWKPTI